MLLLLLLLGLDDALLEALICFILRACSWLRWSCDASCCLKASTSDSLKQTTHLSCQLSSNFVLWANISIVHWRIKTSNTLACLSTTKDVFSLENEALDWNVLLEAVVVERVRWRLSRQPRRLLEHSAAHLCGKPRSAGHSGIKT